MKEVRFFWQSGRILGGTKIQALIHCFPDSGGAGCPQPAVVVPQSLLATQRALGGPSAPVRAHIHEINQAKTFGARHFLR